MTDDLIDRLSSDLAPARKGLVATRLGLALCVGAPVATVGVLLILGPRPDLAEAIGSPVFWMKLAYTLAFALVGGICVERLARPSGQIGARLPWILVPIMAVGLVAAAQILRAPAGDVPHLILGASASVCPWYIAATSLPVFVSVIWVLRGLAPTRLRLAGAVAGLAAGGVGASVYCLHCPEATAPFVGLWYTLGMLIPTVLGALLGPRLLRW